MQKLTIKNTGILGINQLDYLYDPNTNSVLFVVSYDNTIPNGKEVFERLCREFPEVYVPLVREAACRATGATVEEFESKSRADKAVYARGMFWRYLMLEKGLNDRRASKAGGGGKDRVTVRHAVFKDRRYLIPIEKLWEERFDRLLREQRLRVKSETTETSEPQTRS